jgi:hypothetical protein
MSRDFHARDFLANVAQRPIIQAIRERFNFEAAMLVKTNGSVDYIAARDYARSDQMSGRVRPQPNKRDDLVLWFFENDEDAILFAFKFATSLPARLDNELRETLKSVAPPQ